MKTIIHYKTFTIRLLPTEDQEDLMWKSANVARFCYNWALSVEMERFKNGEKFLSGYDLRKLLNGIKKEEFPWILEVSQKVMADAVLTLANAYSNFFTKQKKKDYVKFSKKKIAHYKRIGKSLTPYDMNGHPKFKSKKREIPRFYVRDDACYFKDGMVNIERIGKVKIQTNYTLPQGRGWNFINPRVKYINGKWILTVSIECENQAPVLNEYSLGIDVGIKSTAVISYNGNSKTFKNINKTGRVKRLVKQLTHQQRKLSKCYLKNGNYNETNNTKKYKDKIRWLYYHLANIRSNYNHHISKEIVSLLPSRIVMEDLNIEGMRKNKHLSKAISDQCLYQLIYDIAYKSEMNGIEIKKVSRWYPSSKTCSHCGTIKKDLKLSDRVYKCPVCGLVIDRDLNAAINLEKFEN